MQVSNLLPYVVLFFSMGMTFMAWNELYAINTGNRFGYSPWNVINKNTFLHRLFYRIYRRDEKKHCIEFELLYTKVIPLLINTAILLAAFVLYLIWWITGNTGIHAFLIHPLTGFLCVLWYICSVIYWRLI